MKEQHPSMPIPSRIEYSCNFWWYKEKVLLTISKSNKIISTTGGPSGQVQEKETNTMANASTTGFGLRTVMTLGNTPATSGQSEYKIKSGLGVGIFKNNPVSIQDSSGDEGYIQDASFATTDDGGSRWSSVRNTGHAPLIGVFNGCFFINSTSGKPTFAKLSSSKHNIWN